MRVDAFETLRVSESVCMCAGAAEGKPSAPVPVGAGQPAVSASQYATQAGADLNVPMHASLHLEEQSSAQLES